MTEKTDIEIKEFEKKYKAASEGKNAKRFYEAVRTWGKRKMEETKT